MDADTYAYARIIAGNKTGNVSMRSQAELVLPLILVAPLLVLLQHYGWDIAVSRWFFDAATGKFPLSNNWWLKQVLHDDAKHAAFVFLWVVFVAAVMTHLYRPVAEYRRMLWQLFAVIVISAQTVALIKHFSSPACPYELQMFGGSEPLVGFLDAIPEGYMAGHCWPGGHGSTAFSLFCLYFAAQDAGRKRLALGLLAFVLLFGLALSVTQVARGMHFVSHQVWTALICWYLTWLIYRIGNMPQYVMPWRPNAHRTCSRTIDEG